MLDKIILREIRHTKIQTCTVHNKWNLYLPGFVAFPNILCALYPWDPWIIYIVTLIANWLICPATLHNEHLCFSWQRVVICRYTIKGICTSTHRRSLHLACMFSANLCGPAHIAVTNQLYVTYTNMKKIRQGKSLNFFFSKLSLHAKKYS